MNFITNYKKYDKTIHTAVDEYRERGYHGIFGTDKHKGVRGYMCLYGTDDVDVAILFNILNRIRTEETIKHRIKKQEPFLTVQEMTI
jgi:hypothetical protein